MLTLPTLCTGLTTSGLSFTHRVLRIHCRTGRTRMVDRSGKKSGGLKPAKDTGVDPGGDEETGWDSGLSAQLLPQLLFVSLLQPPCPVPRTTRRPLQPFWQREIQDPSVANGVWGEGCQGLLGTVSFPKKTSPSLGITMSTAWN